jgi:hypothetical protein
MFTRAIFIRPDSELIRKAFAHVRNCLLMKKAHGKKLNRGRTKTLTDSVRK